MIIENGGVNLVSSTEDVVEKGLKTSENGLKLLIEAIASNIYKNPIRAILLEYVCNALDSHVMAGTNDKIDVTLPSYSRHYYRVRDYGVGMTEENINNIFQFIGESNKRDSQDYIGAFGLGRLCFSSYRNTPTIFYRCFDGNFVSEYILRLQSGEGGITLLSREPSSEKKGVEVTIGVHSNDVSVFRKEAFSLYLGLYNKINFVDDENISEFKTICESLEDHGYYITSKNKLTEQVFVSDIPYPLDVGLLCNKIFGRDMFHFHNLNIFFKFKTGEVDLVPSRDSLRYTEKTIEAYKSKLFKYIVDLSLKIIKEYNKLTKISELQNFREVYGLKPPTNLIELLQSLNLDLIKQYCKKTLSDADYNLLYPHNGILFCNPNFSELEQYSDYIGSIGKVLKLDNFFDLRVPLFNWKNTVDSSLFPYASRAEMKEALENSLDKTIPLVYGKKIIHFCLTMSNNARYDGYSSFSSVQNGWSPFPDKQNIVIFYDSREEKHFRCHEYMITNTANKFIYKYRNRITRFVNKLSSTMDNAEANTSLDDEHKNIINIVDKWKKKINNTLKLNVFLVDESVMDRLYINTMFSSSFKGGEGYLVFNDMLEIFEDVDFDFEEETETTKDAQIKRKPKITKEWDVIQIDSEGRLIFSREKGGHALRKSVEKGGNYLLYYGTSRYDVEGFLNNDSYTKRIHALYACMPQLKGKKIWLVDKSVYRTFSSSHNFFTSVVHLLQNNPVPENSYLYKTHLILGKILRSGPSLSNWSILLESHCLGETLEYLWKDYKKDISFIIDVGDFKNFFETRGYRDLYPKLKEIHRSNVVIPSDDVLSFFAFCRVNVASDRESFLKNLIFFKNLSLKSTQNSLNSSI